MKSQKVELLHLHKIIGYLEEEKLCNKEKLMEYVNLNKSKIDLALNFLIKHKIVVELKNYECSRFFALKRIWEKNV